MGGLCLRELPVMIVTRWMDAWTEAGVAFQRIMVIVLLRLCFARPTLLYLDQQQSDELAAAVSLSLRVLNAATLRAPMA